MKKLTLITLLTSVALLAQGCGVLKTQDQVKDMFDESLYSEITEVYSKPQEIADIASALKGAGVEQPYTVYNDSFNYTDGELTFDTLDDTDHIVHLIYDGEHTHVIYEIRYEDKALIESAVKAMIGQDVSYSIEKDNDNNTIVKAQGVTYEWKDGILEKIQ